MYGIGAGEALIIFIIVLVLFGPTLIAFLLGYSIGQRRGRTESSAAPVTPPEPAQPAAPTPAEAPPATSAEPAEVPAPPLAAAPEGAEPAGSPAEDANADG